MNNRICPTHPKVSLMLLSHIMMIHAELIFSDVQNSVSTDHGCEMVHYLKRSFNNKYRLDLCHHCLLADLPFPQLQVSSWTNRTKSVSSQKASSLLLVGFGERQVEVEQTVSGCGWCFFIVPASIRFKQTNLLELNMKYPQFQTYNWHNLQVQT